MAGISCSMWEGFYFSPYFFTKADFSPPPIVICSAVEEIAGFCILFPRLFPPLAWIRSLSHPIRGSLTKGKKANTVGIPDHGSPVPPVVWALCSQVNYSRVKKGFLEFLPWFVSALN